MPRNPNQSPTWPAAEPLGKQEQELFLAFFCEHLNIHFLSAVSQLERLKQSLQRDNKKDNPHILFSNLEDYWRSLQPKMEKMCDNLANQSIPLPLHHWREALALGHIFSAQLLQISKDNPIPSHPPQEELIRGWVERFFIWEQTMAGANYIQTHLKKSIETPRLLFQLTVDVTVIDLFGQWVARRLEQEALQALVQVQPPAPKTRL